MKKTIAVGGVAVLLLSGCGLQGADTRDLEGVKGKDPKKVELYINVDKHPNLVRLCIDGVGFLTSSRDMDAVLRVPEFDAWCQA